MFSKERTPEFDGAFGPALREGGTGYKALMHRHGLTTQRFSRTICFIIAFSRYFNNLLRFAAKAQIPEGGMEMLFNPIRKRGLVCCDQFFSALAGKIGVVESLYFDAQMMFPTQFKYPPRRSIITENNTFYMDHSFEPDITMLSTKVRCANRYRITSGMQQMSTPMEISCCWRPTGTIIGLEASLEK